MGRRAELGMSWKTQSNSNRQEEGNGQDGCGNTGDVTDEKHRKEQGRAAGTKERRQSGNKKRTVAMTLISVTTIFVYLKIYIHIV